MLCPPENPKQWISAFLVSDQWRQTASPILKRRCMNRSTVGYVLDELLHPALEELAQSIQVLSRCVVAAFVRNLGERGPMDAGDACHFLQSDAATLAEFSIGNKFLQTISDHEAMDSVQAR